MPRNITATDLLKFQLVSDVQLSPNGDTALFTLTHLDKKKNTYQSHIWKVSTKSGAPQQFTNSSESESNARWSPSGKSILFVSARDTEKAQKGKNQIWILPTDGGEATKLTDHKNNISNPMWSPNGKQILFTASVPIAKTKSKSDVTHTVRLSYRFNGSGYTYKSRTHLFVISARGGRPKQITSGEWDVNSATWSTDGSEIYIIGNAEEDTDRSYARNLYAISPKSGRRKRLCGLPGNIGGVAPSPNGKTIAFSGSDFSRSYGTNNHIYLIPTSGGTPKCLTKHLDISVEQNLNSDSRKASPSFGLVWSPDGRLIKYIATTRGADRLFSLNVETGHLNAYTDDKHTLESVSYNADHTAAAYTAMTPTRLAEVSLWREGKTDRRLTRFNDRTLSNLHLSKPKRFSFKASDGIDVEGWIMLPLGSRKRKHPSILQIHGGPRTAYGQGFIHEFHLLNAKGFAVYYINPRGSSSYGEDWTCAVGGNYGERDYADIMEAVDHVVKTEPLAPNRLGVTGGSYGGFMTNWIVGHTDRFKAACTQRCISNWTSFFGTSDIGWRFPQEEIGGCPWDNLENYWARSPIAYVKNVKTPTLIIHSEEDWRCPIEQSEQFFVALQVLGIETELVRFPGENHELSRSGKPNHRIERLDHIVRWFEKYLLAKK